MSSDNNLDKEFQEKSMGGTLVEKLTKEIEAHLNNDQFGVDSLAQAVGMSRSSLHRKLHKMVGVSTSQFIREYRLKRALELLREGNITASEVAYRVGFSSATYFSTSFHKFYGYTPGEVKSRDANELVEGSEPSILEINQGMPSHVALSKRQKGNYNKSLILSVLLIAVVSTAFFLYSTTSKKNVETKGMENLIEEKSIAVLPFKNWTGDPNLEYISDGMTDAVISRLTKINSIDKVIPFTSTIKYKETNRSTQEIATELGVTNLLQGNLQISGEQIKINLQMIDSRTNDHLWSEEYVREWRSDEIFKMQTEVVEGIAANMNAVIADNELDNIQKVPTKSKQAYSYYLQAEFQKNKANELSYSNAIALYEKAIAIDPNFIDAYRGQATVWSFGGLVWGIYDEQEAWRNAKKLLEKALKLDPTNKEVEEELYSGYFFYDWRFEEVEKYYQRILKDSFIDNTPSINADYAIKTGRYQNALNAMNEVILTDSSSGFLFFFKAEALFFLGKTEEALELLNNTYSLHSDNWFYLRESAKLNYYLKEYQKSKKQLHKLLTQFPDYPPILMWLNAVYAQMDGDTVDASKYLVELESKYENRSSGSPAWFIALFYSTQKNYEKTFEWLQRSYERHEVEMTWLREEPLLAPLRNDPRYISLYDKVGFSSIGIPIKTSSEINSSN
ncbi:helix-turn-helix domain-containing protein [Arenibacter sp. M-2]|uniref:helix-turn-helix domain-containing protein n=1 Tax=Arenibacter sp. M-2 TaxID=3053612 RepID=UPI00257114FE|nr:helix-turn-helix domain-containing protein [Arenibacter sp. M-2]MDL5510497.1 helix-turn-helix domain-containing protein [Arenibacter sp. M-2]